MPPDDDKTALRRRLRAQRDALAPAERAQRSSELCRRVLALDCVRDASLIAGYRGFGSEADVGAVLEGATRAGVALALPRVEAPGELSLRAWTPGEALLPNRWGIDEPLAAAPAVPLDAVSVVLVPALGLDRRGQRIGYGGGYYDRLLPRLGGAVRIGVAFELQLLDALAGEAHDALLDFVVTETGAYAVSH
jgi:5-formyltetrahydrofolate cyclo-ligase